MVRPSEDRVDRHRMTRTGGPVDGKLIPPRGRPERDSAPAHVKETCPLPNAKLLPPLVICTALALSPAMAASGPRAHFLERPSSPVSGEVTTFDASRSSCDREPCSYRWSIVSTLERLRRARAVETGRVFRYRFRGAGARYVRLTVANDRGRRSTLTKTLVVSRAPSPSRSASISLEPVDGGAGYYRQFSNSLPTIRGSSRLACGARTTSRSRTSPRTRTSA